MCSVEVRTEQLQADLSGVKLLAEEREMLGDSLKLYQKGNSYVADLRITPDGDTYRMVCNRTFAEAQAYIGKTGQASADALRGFLMFVYAQSAVLCRTAMLHASVVIKDGKGYAFLGKSGTGKSTHSSLWLKTFEDAELLNDDNPVIRLEEDDKVYIYGSPWSGKTPCYRNLRVPLEAYVRLEQAPVNVFIHKEGLAAFVDLLPSCSAMRWDGYLYSALCDLVQECTTRVEAGYLKCLPNEEAARMCYNELTKKNI
jgi:hypothetical protein